MDDRVIAEPPSSLSLAAQAAVDMVMMPVREASALGSALTNPGAVAQQFTDMGRAMVRMAVRCCPPPDRRCPGRSASSAVHLGPGLAE